MVRVYYRCSYLRSSLSFSSERVEQWIRWTGYSCEGRRFFIIIQLLARHSFDKTNAGSMRKLTVRLLKNARVMVKLLPQEQS